MSQRIQRLYGNTDPLDIPIWDPTGAALIGTALVAGDVMISKDGGTYNNVTNLPTNTGGYAPFTPAAADLQCKRAVLRIMDQDSPALFLPQFIIIETVGHASAMLPYVGASGVPMTLTSGERTTLANVIEAEIIDDTDSEKVLTAITDKIASVNPSLGGLTLAAIASAVRTDLDASSTRLSTAATNLSTLLTRITGAVPLAADWSPTRAGKIDQLDAIATKSGQIPSNIAARFDTVDSGIGALGDVDEIAAAVAAALVEPGMTLRDALRVVLSTLLGLTTGAGTTSEGFKSVRGDGNPAALTRVTVTNDGTNRTAVVLDLADET